jgi:colicin import membrane protein
MWKAIRENPRAVFYAVLMHLLLLALLVVSLDWSPKPSTTASAPKPVQAELVDAKGLNEAEEHKQEELRQQAEAEVEAKRKAEAEAEAQRKAEAEAKRKAEAEAKRKAEAEAKRKAEAEAKHKAEAEAKRKAEAEAKRKAEAEAKRKAEAEAKRKAEAEAKRKAEAEAKRKAEAEAEARRKAEEEARRKAEEEALQAKLAAERAQLQAARDRAARSAVAEYTAYIREKVERNWLRPPGSREGLSCTVRVNMIPGGEVVGVTIIQGSGDPLFDRSVETAVYKASPLPLPPDSDMFNYFRELRLVFKPE